MTLHHAITNNNIVSIKENPVINDVYRQKEQLNKVKYTFNFK
ncbi:hypothetical protein RintRC_2335 [Richelia intracellularis]|nr:hypothetical protein RintRC_2335 [Richelia intracellularis]